MWVALAWKYRNLIGAGLAVLAVLGLWAVWVHRGHELASTRAALASETALFKQEHQSFLAEQAHSRALEAARTSDHKDAITDANTHDKTCQARVDTARKSATAITHLLNEPPHANPDPAEPELLTAGELRSALGR